MRDKVFLLITAIMSGLLSGMYFMKKHKDKQIAGANWEIDKYVKHFQLLNHWLEIKSEGKSAAAYFEEMGYKHIAIYGMAELSNRLYEDLFDSLVHIDYGIDRDVSCCMGRIDEIYFPEDELPETDVIVVTPYSIYEDIKAILEKKVTCPIISIEDIIWSI